MRIRERDMAQKVEIIEQHIIWQKGGLENRMWPKRGIEFEAACSRYTPRASVEKERITESSKVKKKRGLGNGT